MENFSFTAGLINKLNRLIKSGCQDQRLSLTQPDTLAHLSETEAGKGQTLSYNSVTNITKQITSNNSTTCLYLNMKQIVLKHRVIWLYLYRNHESAQRYFSSYDSLGPRIPQASVLYLSAQKAYSSIPDNEEPVVQVSRFSGWRCSVLTLTTSSSNIQQLFASFTSSSTGAVADISSNCWYYNSQAVFGLWNFPALWWLVNVTDIELRVLRTCES